MVSRKFPSLLSLPNSRSLIPMLFSLTVSGKPRLGRSTGLSSLLLVFGGNRRSIRLVRNRLTYKATCARYNGD